MTDTQGSRMPFELPVELEAELRTPVLQYVSALESRGVTVVFDAKHFCELVGVEANYAFAVANEPRKNYRTLRIPKKSGGIRLIHAPLPTLKIIQRWILDNVLSGLVFHKAATAYIAKKSIKDNARIHRAQSAILKLDISSFFSSIRINSVYEIFYQFGYTKSISTLLAHLCTLGGVLPQGAPTSGALANAYLTDFDQRALDFCLLANLRYTRYSDDITISGNKIDVDTVGQWFATELALLGLRLNAKKTVHRRSGDRLLVTGLVVNEKINLLRSTLMQIRKEHHYIMKFGAHSHAKRVGLSPLYAVEALAGRLAFAIGIKPYDTKLRAMLSELRDVRRDLRREMRLIGRSLPPSSDAQYLKKTRLRQTFDVAVPAPPAPWWDIENDS